MRCVARGSLAISVALLWTLGGCISSTESRTKSPTDSRLRQSGALSNTDPCAMRLHDISGAILFYYASHHQLPPTLAELRAMPGFDQLEFICPESNLAYVYAPGGLPAPNQPGAKIIV